jgi:hypothetical protein
MENRKRGYCQLNIGGQDRTLHFSMNFWVAFEDASGYKISEIDQVFSNGISLNTIRALVYAGLLAYDQENGIKPDYNIYTVGSWMEDLQPESLTLLTNTLMESRVLGNDLNAGVRRNVEKSTKNPKQINP